MKLNEKDVIATMIREQITVLDELARQRLEEVDNNVPVKGRIGTDHVSLSSALTPCTVEFIESSFGSGDNAFKDFRKRLGKALTSIFNTRIDVGLYDEVNIS